MSGSVYSWSQTADDNKTADGDVAWPEGQNSKTVNNSARAMMVRVAEYRDDQGGLIAVAGTANAITATLNSAFTTLADGRHFTLQPSDDNTDAVTLNVNSIGAKAIRKFDSTGEVALASGDLQAGAFYDLIYDSAADTGSGAWIIKNPTPKEFQASSSKLTDIAALTPTDSNFIVGNGTTWVAESGATVRTSLGLGTAATTDATAYATAAQGALADSALQSVADASATVKGLVELATTTEARTATDTVRAVTPAGIGATVIGIGQTWQDLLASRSANTVYQNTTGRPIMVGVEGDSLVLSVSADNSTYIVVGVSVSTGHQMQTVIVPSGHYYKVNNTPSHWIELR